MDEAQLERIVREVTQRLMAMNHPVSDRSSATVPPAAAELHGHSTPSAVRTLRVADRVVTMARLSGRLEGITRVQVAAKAIVTPLVADELREQGIQLERQTQRQTVPSTGRADQLPSSLWLVADAADARRIAGLLRETVGDTRQLGASGDVAAQVASMPPSSRAIVLASDWAHVVCRMNRRPELRAAVAWNTATLEQACRQMDPNVLVIDSTQLSDAQLHNLIRQYVQHARQTATHP